MLKRERNPTVLRSLVVYTPMHEVTPKVVAMAVSTVITMFRILLQISLFMVLNRFSLCFWFHHRVHRVFSDRVLNNTSLSFKFSPPDGE